MRRLSAYRTLGSLQFFFHMPIFRALGTGFLLILLLLLAPRVFHGLEDTIVASLNTAQALMSVSEKAIISGSFPLLPSSAR